MHYHATCRKWSFLKIMYDISNVILWKATMPCDLSVCWMHADVSNSPSCLVNMVCTKCSILLKTGNLLALLLIWRQENSRKMSADVPASGLLVNLILSPPFTHHSLYPSFVATYRRYFSSVQFSSCQNSGIMF